MYIYLYVRNDVMVIKLFGNDFHSFLVDKVC